MPDERTRKPSRSFIDLNHSGKREEYEHHLIKSAQVVRDALGFREGSIFYQASTARTDTMMEPTSPPLTQTRSSEKPENGKKKLN